MYFVYNKRDGICLYGHEKLNKCMRYIASSYYDRDICAIFYVEFAAGRCVLTEVSYYDKDEKRYRNSGQSTFIDLDFFWDSDFLDDNG